MLMAVMCVFVGGRPPTTTHGRPGSDRQQARTVVAAADTQTQICGHFGREVAFVVCASNRNREAGPGALGPGVLGNALQQTKGHLMLQHLLAGLYPNAEAHSKTTQPPSATGGIWAPGRTQARLFEIAGIISLAIGVDDLNTPK